LWRGPAGRPAGRPASRWQVSLTCRPAGYGGNPGCYWVIVLLGGLSGAEAELGITSSASARTVICSRTKHVKVAPGFGKTVHDDPRKCCFLGHLLQAHLTDGYIVYDCTWVISPTTFSADKAISTPTAGAMDEAHPAFAITFCA
jgi:hypothetical protein